MPRLSVVRGLPPCLVALLAIIWPTVKELHTELTRDLDGHETFAGKAAVTRNCIQKGLAFLSMDKHVAREGQLREPESDAEDVTTITGFRALLSRSLRIRVRGLGWFAPECKTLGWIGRYGTGRNKQTPSGDTSQHRIQMSNLQIGMVTVVCLVLWLRDVYFIIENPKGSVMPDVAPMKQFLAFVKQVPPIVTTYMGAFGGETCKPLSFWGTWVQARKLSRTMPRDKSRLAKKKGRWTQGNPDELTISSAYPEEFGAAVAEVFEHVFCVPTATQPMFS
jgi:hypothetical protein